MRTMNKSLEHSAPRSIFDGVCNVLCFIKVVIKIQFARRAANASIKSRTKKIMAFVFSILKLSCKSVSFMLPWCPCYEGFTYGVRAIKVLLLVVMSCQRQKGNIVQYGSVTKA